MLVNKQKYRIEKSDFKNLWDIVCLIEEKTRELLVDTLIDKEVSLPIPIEEVAEKLELQVVTDNLNFANPRKANQRIGELSGTHIVIDEKVEWEVGRYAIAHEIGHYIFSEDREVDESVQYTLPLLSTNEEEIIADIYAMFLMIPFDLFLECFKEYMDSIEKYPVDITDWWRVLSVKAEIPFHSVASGYNWLKTRAIKHYKNEVEGKAIQEQIKNYGELFF